MIHKLQENRTLTLFLLGGGLLLIIVGYFYLQQSNEILALEEEHAALDADLTALEREAAAKRAEVDRQRSDATIEATGLNPDLVDVDEDIATTFFSPAFSWVNAEEYNTVRNHMIDELGKNNTFTDTYMPEDVTIETDEGTLSYIDHEGLRAQVGEMIITPLVSEADNRIRYVTIAEYYMHQESSDLANTDALDASHAVIEFTVSGPEGDRKVSEVEAWTGFTTTVNE